MVYTTELRILTRGTFLLTLAVLFFSIPAFAQTPLLHTTLDSISAVSSPLAGTGTGSSVNAATFVPGQIGSAAHFAAGTNQYIRYQQTDGVTQNIETEKGTIEFWYKPNYNHNDGTNRFIFSTSNAFSPGTIALRKFPNSELGVMFINSSSKLGEVIASSSSYSWAAGQWVKIRVTWDTTVAPGVQGARIYINDVELSYSFITWRGTHGVPAESTSQHIYIGTHNAVSTGGANGAIDEFVVYDQPLPPAPPTDTTPPSVSITSPANGAAVQFSVSVDVSASDNAAVGYVELYKDGLLFGNDTGVPYQFAWDTTQDSNGPHALQARAVDTSGNSALSGAISVTVNNSNATRPDIILILTDDQRWDTTQYMPLTNALLADSIKFDSAFATTALCCPSRASILTGLYAHNHGVRRNWHRFNEGGGAPKFNDTSTIATWLDAAGYRTGIYGKYLNDYIFLNPYPYTPPGWDEWHVIVEEATQAFYNYTMAENGALVSYGSAPNDYSTDVLAAKAVSFIETASAGQPIFLYFTPVAPHAPAPAAPRHVGAYAGLAPWRPPSFNEADVSDKQSFVANRPLMNATEIAAGDALRITQIESLLAVDEAVADIYDALNRTGRLNNTVIIFMSDSGLFWGEHRVVDSKECVYEECVRIPLWIKAPGVTARTDTNIVATIDIAPTIAEFAGTVPATAVNGLSMSPLLNDPSASWRNEILLENLGVFPSVTVDAVRTAQYHYADYWQIGGKEFYDLAVDPYQLENKINDPAYASVISNLANTLAALKGSSPADTNPPVRSNGSPSGTLPTGVTQATISLDTDENANCRYNTLPGISYSSMTSSFANTGGTSHSTLATGLSNGNTYNYYVKCQDAFGNANTNDFLITFLIAADTLIPNVAITSPANGATISGTVTVTANANDNVGVVGVQFILDGNNLGAEDTAAPYSVSWNTAAAIDGAHNLSAVARDAAGNMNSNTIFVIVNNTIPDTAPPVLSNGQPSGMLPSGTTQATLQAATDEAATCRYSITPGISYASMADTFTTTGNTAHSTLVTGLSDGNSYTFYVRCQDAAGNANANDFTITFSVAAAPTSGTLLHTTLDSISAVSSPLAGTGTGSSVNAATFVPGQIGSAAHFAAGTNQYIRYQQTDGVTQNIETEKGTIEFWYKPNYNHNDGVNYFIFGTGAFPTTGALYLRKYMNGDLGVLTITPSLTLKEVISPASSYSWAAGQWVKIRVTWDMAVAPGVQGVRIYFNDAELPYSFVTWTGPQASLVESAVNHIYVGQRGANFASGGANGAIDEFVVYDQPLPPAPPTDTTPPSVSITSPANGAAVQFSVSVDVSASDNAAVGYVELYKDGNLLGNRSSVPYSFAWDTTQDSNGPHALQARAVDTSGNSASHTVTVNVNNSNTTRLNFVVILTDDQRWDTMQYMPITMSVLAANGVEFTNGFVSTPICCPSRSSILTGQYTHNHKVIDNNNNFGGAKMFNDTSTLAVWLDQAGYRTGLYGKYLNGYDSTLPGWPYVPPGWDEWHAHKEPDIQYYNYTLVENGALVFYGGQPQDYSTTVLANKAMQFISSTPNGTPFFLYFTPLTPHAPYTPAPNDTVSSLPPWRPPSYNETDISDKPQHVHMEPVINAQLEGVIDNIRNSQVAMLQSADRAVGDIVSLLAATGRLNNTVIIFTSDNGFMWGEHRLVQKNYVYEESIRVPFIVRAPGLTPRQDSNLVQNIDIAPTIAEFAGVMPPTKIDGVSLASLLSNPSVPWRQEILEETMGGFLAFSSSNTSHFHAVRTHQYLYAEYFNGDKEFYDLTADPYQLDSRHNDPAYAAIITNLTSILNFLKAS